MDDTKRERRDKEGRSSPGIHIVEWEQVCLWLRQGGRLLEKDRSGGHGERSKSLYPSICLVYGRAARCEWLDESFSDIAKTNVKIKRTNMVVNIPLITNPA